MLFAHLGTPFVSPSLTSPALTLPVPTLPLYPGMTGPQRRRSQSVCAGTAELSRSCIRLVEFQTPTKFSIGLAILIIAKTGLLKSQN